MPILASEGCFWPLTASITSEAKINYAYVTTQGICNNFIEVNFCMGPMVWRPNPLFQASTTMSLIDKMRKVYLVCIIKFAFKTTKVSWCSSYFTYLIFII